MTTNIITYEQPLNEHIRLCLRLEHLFERCREHIADKTASGSRIAITALLKVLNVVDRPDLKTKLSQVLSQQVGSLAQLEQSPRVDAYKLQQALTHLDQLLKTLHQTKTKFGEILKQNSFLNQVRTQLNNPAGPCHITTPAYALWLKGPSEKRIDDLTTWYHTLDELAEIIHTILRFTRESSPPQNLVAANDFYQQALSTNLPCQMIRITLPVDLYIYPEISAGKHRLSVRFKALNTQYLSKQETNTTGLHSIPFTLQCCRI